MFIQAGQHIVAFFCAGIEVSFPHSLWGPPPQAYEDGILLRSLGTFHCSDSLHCIWQFLVTSFLFLTSSFLGWVALVNWALLLQTVIAYYDT